MGEDRLLIRIRTRDRKPDRRITQDSDKVITSVLWHLQKILNTKQGNVPIAEDYGFPDITSFRHLPSSSIEKEIEKSICSTIEKYEPRLKCVRVTFISPEEKAAKKNELVANFQIHAQLVLESQKESIMFESKIDSYGKIKIGDDYV